ncbi:MAG TPA: hypothetical protein VE645_19400 [Pseudonocardiaceae bacterium]|nr:hypothetical protein [Pseudonocardiaceae bacterium]
MPQSNVSHAAVPSAVVRLRPAEVHVSTKFPARKPFGIAASGPTGLLAAQVLQFLLAGSRLAWSLG